MRKVLVFMTVSIVFLSMLLISAFGDDTRGLIVEGRTLVPVRGVFEELGFDVIWDAQTQTAFLGDDEYTVRISKGESSFTTNDKTIVPEVPQQVISERFYLPLRAVADSIGAKTTWDGESKVALIEYKESKAFVFCGSVTSSEYAPANETTTTIETSVETTTEEVIGVQDIREISEDVEDNGLKISFLPDERNDYQGAESMNVYLYNKVNELVYEERNKSINIENNDNYVEFEITEDDLRSPILEGDLKSYTNCTIKIEVMKNGEICAEGEHKIGAHITYNTTYTDAYYDIKINCVETSVNRDNKIIARFHIEGEAEEKMEIDTYFANGMSMSIPMALPTLEFVGYDLNDEVVERVSLGVSFSDEFDIEQNYEFSTSVAHIKLEER